MFEKRHELTKLIPPGSVAVELGVAKGEFSYQLLYHGENIEVLYSIDRWNDHHTEEEFLETKLLLSQYGERSKIIRMPFNQAVHLFENYFFDFIYIDGYAHTGQEAGKTLEQWWPKLKPGGIFSGHDYHKQFKPTVKAVDAFAAQHKLGLNFTNEKPPGAWPSWYCFKP